MPQPPAVDVQPPVPPTPPAPPALPGVPGVAQAPVGINTPITPEQAEFLRARRSALSRQLESVQERRDEVADQLRAEETQAAERPGLQERLRVLDERLVQIERDIAANSEQLSNAPVVRSESTAPARGDGGFMGGANPNLVTIFSFALLLPFAIQLARRFFAPNRTASRTELAEMRAMTERMNQMDVALDTVAIEVERIGEGQRFLTQAMTENLRKPGSIGSPEPAYERVSLEERDPVERR